MQYSFAFLFVCLVQILQSIKKHDKIFLMHIYTKTRGFFDLVWCADLPQVYYRNLRNKLNHVETNALFYKFTYYFQRPLDYTSPTVTHSKKLQKIKLQIN